MGLENKSLTCCESRIQQDCRLNKCLRSSKEAGKIACKFCLDSIKKMRYILLGKPSLYLPRRYLNLKFPGHRNEENGKVSVGVLAADHWGGDHSCSMAEDG